MITLPCRAVLFDCDGVLVDSDDTVATAWTKWAADFGLDAATVLAAVHGRRTVDTVAEFVPDELRATAVQRIDSYELDLAAATEPIPGAEALVRSMPEQSWAVVTSGTADLARARLRAAGFPPPRVLVSAEDVTRGKPDPEGYRSAAARLGVSAAETIVLEDAEAGLRAARAAGVGVVIGVGSRDLGVVPDIAVPDLEEFQWSDGVLYLPY